MSEIALLLSSRKPGQCSSRTCLRDLEWYRTVRGRAMPMNAGARPIRTETVDGQTVGYFSSDDSHWATCPAASRFHRRS